MSKTDLRHLLKKSASDGKDVGGVSLPQAPSAVVFGLVQEPTSRILKVQGGYACGLCGKKKLTLELAYSCLQTCTVNRRLRAPVSSQPAVSGMVYHCSFCSRTYKNFRNAEECARGCVHSQAIPQELQNEITHAYSAHLRTQLTQVRGPLERRFSPKPPPVQFTGFQNASVAPQTVDLPLEITEDVDEPEITQSALPTAEVRVAADPVSEPAVEREQTIVNTEGLLYRTRGQKPFKRMDAKYACSVCATLFFTKSEVDACFEAHPLLDPDV